MDLRLYSPIQRHRFQLAQEIADLSDFSRLNILQKLLADRNIQCRAIAARGLAKVPHESSIGLLIRALEDPAVDPRREAAASLGTVGKELNDLRMLQPLLRSLKDIDPGVRAFAGSALGKLGAESAINDLSTSIDAENTWAIAPMIAGAVSLGWKANSPIALTVLACVNGEWDLVYKNSHGAAWFYEQLALAKEAPLESRRSAIEMLGGLDCVLAYDALRGYRSELIGADIRRVLRGELRDTLEHVHEKWSSRDVSRKNKSRFRRQYRRTDEWVIMVTIGAAGAIIPNDIAQSATVQFSERRARPGEFSADTVCVLYSLGAYPTEFGGQFIFDSISVTDPVGRPAKPNAIQSQRIWKEINASWSGHWSATDQWVKDDFLSVVSPSDAIPENVQSPANEVFADLPSGGVANPFENEVIESTDKYLAEMEYCSHTPGADILAREKRASAGLLLCINKLAQLKTPNARRTLEKIRNSDVLFAQEIQAAKTALAKFADPHCQSCKVIHKHLRLWLDGPEPNLYLCDECIRNQGLHESIGNSVTPSLMPHLIAENQLLEGPGLGGPAFSLALDAWNSGSHSLAAEKYSEALGKGLNPPYEAAARSNFGQILLNDGRIREALVQFSGALFVSPQMAESAYDAAIRLFIINEELGQTAQAGRAERIAQIAAARINSSLSPESAKRIRRLVRDKFPKE